MSAPLLVDAGWLLAHAGDPDVRVVDFRWYMQGNQGAAAYAEGHVPGSVFVDLEDVSAPEGPGRHPLPDPARLAAAMRAAGVSRGTHVVALDDTGGAIASRLWWLLRAHGHPRASVLDGGLQAWTAAGGALVRDVPAVAPGDFEATPRAPWVVDKRAVATALSAGALLLDARARERYRGEREPIDARPGHIPGAKSAPWAENLQDGRFKSAAALRERYRALGATGDVPVIVYCGSGVTACHDILALERAGMGGAMLYEGSWSDWARDASLAAALGDDP